MQRIRGGWNALLTFSIWIEYYQSFQMTILLIYKFSFEYETKTNDIGALNCYASSKFSASEYNFKCKYSIDCIFQHA